MKIKGFVLLTSFITASILISGGYGYWQKELTIKGDITIVKPVLMQSIIEEPLMEEINNEPAENVLEEELKLTNQVEDHNVTDSTSIETIPQEPDQLDVQGDKSDEAGPSELDGTSEQSQQSVNVPLNKQVGEEQDQAPSIVDSEPKEDEESPNTEPKETISLPQDNVEDGN